MKSKHVEKREIRKERINRILKQKVILAESKAGKLYCELYMRMYRAADTTQGNKNECVLQREVAQDASSARSRFCWYRKCISASLKQRHR
jgi:hypothetical protein